MNKDEVIKLAVEADLIDQRDLDGCSVYTLPESYVQAIFQFAQRIEQPHKQRIAELDQQLKELEENLDITEANLRVLAQRIEQPHLQKIEQLREALHKLINSQGVGAPAVEPVKHKYSAVYLGNTVAIYKDGEQMTIEQIVDDLNGKTVEQSQAVPEGWDSEKIYKEGFCEKYLQKSAIDDETRMMVLELCKLLIANVGPDSMITRHMAQVSEKIIKRLEAGE